jgi:hypothetical protein
MVVTERLVKMLDLAGDSRTDEHTALNAVRQVAKMMTTSGLTFSELLSQPVSAPATTPYMSYDTTQNVIKQHEDTILDLRKNIIKLNGTIVKLEEQVADAKGKVKPDENDNVSYSLFAAEVIKRFSKPKGWQRRFAAQTGVSVARINSYGTKGTVPFEVFQMVKTIDPEMTENTKTVEWTLELVNEVRKLHESGATDNQIAYAISEKVGFTVTDGQVKRLKINSREGIRQFADPAFGGPIGKTRS